MGWMDKFQGQQEGLQGLTAQLMQKNQAEEQDKGSRAGGLFGLLGGALAMLIPGGQVAGIGMMAGGAGRLFGG